MAEQPLKRTSIRDFPGLATNLDRQDLPPGAAAEQVNVASYRPAQLVWRPGLRPVSFDETTSAQSPAPSLTTGIISAWTMNEAAAAQRVDGYSGYNALPTNDPAQVTGIIDNAAACEKSGNRFLIATGANLNRQGLEFTVCGWFKRLLAGSGTIISKGTSPLFLGWRIALTSTKVQLVYNSGVQTTLAEKTAEELNKWYWFCAYCDGLNWGLSLNNDEPSETNFGPVGTDTTTLRFGSSNGTTGLLDAAIDGMHLWGRKLPPVQRAYMFEQRAQL